MSRRFICIAIMALLVSSCLCYPFRDSAATKSRLAKRSLADSAKKSLDVDEEELGLESDCHDIADQHNCMFVLLNIKPCDAYYKENCALSCGECYYMKKK